MKKHIIILFLCAISFSYLSGQCYPDRHSTNFFDGWISCETADNPNAERGKSHFIMYDFGKVYKLGQMKIWNSNDPSHLDRGMRDVIIDHSKDGITWTSAGNFTFAQATGLSTYEGEQGPLLVDVEARYLLITGVNNYGGDCYGFSEMRVEAEEVIISDVEDVSNLDCVDVSLYPNPFQDKVTLSLAAGCNGDLRYVIYDAGGREISAEKVNLQSGSNASVEIGSSLLPGTYMLSIEFGGQSIKRSIVKMSRT